MQPIKRFIFSNMDEYGSVYGYLHFEINLFADINDLLSSRKQNALKVHRLILDMNYGFDYFISSCKCHCGKEMRFVENYGVFDCGYINGRSCWTEKRKYKCKCGFEYLFGERDIIKTNNKNIVIEFHNGKINLKKRRN